jgi:hypothetical protein
MKVRSLKVCGLALAVVASLSSAALACDCLSQTVLSDMGLGGLVVMTDSEALSVRGMGYSPTHAAGWSWASIKFKGASAGSKNSYSAKGKHKAFGDSNSEAGVEIARGHRVKSITAFSGGSSFAGRK